MTCKGICIRHKAQKPVGSGRYATGQKRCQMCEIFIKWDELWCPCCGCRLRTGPRHFKFKAKLIEKRAIEDLIKFSKKSGGITKTGNDNGGDDDDNNNSNN